MRKYEMLASSLQPEMIRRYPYYHRVMPFQIAGGVYYVGNRVCSSHLIDTGEGLLLIDTPFARQLPLLLESVWEAGFRPADIRYILHTHAHADHVGCTPALVSMFGCKTCISETDAQSVEARPELLFSMEDDPDFFEPDILLRDGDTVCLGEVSVRAVATPGHTQGAMSYFFNTTENGRHLNCAVFGGAGFNTLCRDYFLDFGIPMYIRNQFMDSLEKVRPERVDVTLGNHPGANNTFEKQQRREAGETDSPFIDPEEWANYIEDIKRRFILFRAEDDAMSKPSANEKRR
jgi:metallo-beta-lactamase class B